MLLGYITKHTPCVLALGPSWGILWLRASFLACVARQLQLRSSQYEYMCTPGDNENRSRTGSLL